MLCLRLLRRNFKGSTSIRTYLSSQFKDVMNKQPIASKEYQLRLPPGSSIALDLDDIASKLSPAMDRRAEICEQLLKLRSSADATSLLASTNHVVIKHFIDTGSVRELLSILSDRLHYGIFIDKFTGCFLLDHLLKTKDYSAASQVAIELMIQDEFDNELVVALSAKACFNFIKNGKFDNIIPDAEPEPAKDAKSSETKIRVKYLRNPYVNEMDTRDNKVYLVGKTILKLSDKCQHDTKSNLKALGLILCKRYSKLTEALTAKSNIYSKDILNLCLDLIEDKDNNKELSDVISLQLDNNSKPEVFDEQLSLLIIKAVEKQESALIKNQERNYTEWLQDREKKLNKVLEIKSMMDREANIKYLLTETNTRRKKLWFFENKDKIDLEIYRKRVIYPKKWFGKKKKPKVIDDDYVPPEI